MNYPPLKFITKGGPLDGEEWILPNAKTAKILSEGITFNVSRKNDKDEMVPVHGKYEVKFDPQEKTYSATFVDNG